MATNDGDTPGYRLGAFQAGVRELPEFAEAVLSIVDRIPEGMVLAYGDVAEMLGQGGPRQVGAVLSRYGSSVTWWRVIRASGEVPDGLLDEALAHWREEGTALVRGMIAGRRVDMTLARWDGKDPDRGPTEMVVQRIGGRHWV
jgi:alkylated DNA nucleotide flippase Atl1